MPTRAALSFAFFYTFLCKSEGVESVQSSWDLLVGVTRMGAPSRVLPIFLSRLNSPALDSLSGRCLVRPSLPGLMRPLMHLVGWMAECLNTCTGAQRCPPRSPSALPSPAQPLLTSHCKLQSHVASFGAFSEDGAGYRGGLEKPFNWTHPGEFLCQHFWVWVGFCHRFCLDT